MAEGITTARSDGASIQESPFKSQRAIGTWTLLIVNGILLVGLVWLGSRTDFKEDVSAYGHDATSVRRQLVARGAFESEDSNPAFLILAGSAAPAEFNALISYFGRLVSSHPGRVTPVLIIASDMPRPKFQAFPYAIVVDEDHSLHRALGVDANHSHGAMVVLSSTGYVEFGRVGLPTRDEMRQLIEKYSLGRIAYDAFTRRSVELLHHDKTFPNISLIHLVTAKSVDARDALPAATDVVVFSASCPDCQLSIYLDQVQHLQSKKLVYIFDVSFSRVQLARLVMSGHLPNEVYLAPLRELLGAADETRTPDLERPLYLVMGAELAVESVSSEPRRPQ